LEAAQQKLTDLARKHNEKLTKLAQQLEDEATALLAKLKDDGIVPTLDRNYRQPQRPYSVTAGTAQASILLLQIVGKDEAINRVNTAANRLRDTAVRVLNREQRSIQRQVLLQGITAFSAHTLIQDLPKAEDIIVLVQQELQMTSEDDIAELITEVDS
jgi:hypothetical protein